MVLIVLYFCLPRPVNGYHDFRNVCDHFHDSEPWIRVRSECLTQCDPTLNPAPPVPRTTPRGSETICPKWRRDRVALTKPTASNSAKISGEDALPERTGARVRNEPNVSL